MPDMFFNVIFSSYPAAYERLLIKTVRIEELLLILKNSTTTPYYIFIIANKKKTELDSRKISALRIVKIWIELKLDEAQWCVFSS